MPVMYVCPSVADTPEMELLESAGMPPDGRPFDPWHGGAGKEPHAPPPGPVPAATG